jgi:hypothetical protein
MAVELDVDAAPVAAEPKVPPQLLFIHQVCFDLTFSLICINFLAILEIAPTRYSLAHLSF